MVSVLMLVIVDSSSILCRYCPVSTAVTNGLIITFANAKILAILQ